LKISFPKYRSDASATRERLALSIISSLIIGLFAGLCGSYFLENNFWWLTIAVLGVAGILLCLTGAGRALLGRPKVEGARSRRIKKNAPEIKSGWDYRASKAIRPHGDANGAEAETSKVSSPERFAINNNATTHLNAGIILS